MARPIARILRKISARVAVLLATGLLATACAEIRTVDSQQPPAYHAVRTSETLGSIAAAYGVNVGRLARANGLGNGQRIAAGQRLVIPDGGRLRHRVRRDETLQQIAVLYGVRDSTIARINRVSILHRGQQIRPGQWLVLPRDARLPALVPTPTPQRIARRVRPSAPAPSAAPLIEPTREPPRDADLERARSLVERAVDDYRSASFAAALERAREAESTLAGAGDRPETRELSARAVFVTGSALAAQGETERAKESFARVHGLDAGFTPPDGWLSPRLAELYHAAK